MTQANPALAKLLGKIFDELQETDDPDEHAARREEFVFHMTDWADDLRKLGALYESPDQLESGSSVFIAGFLYHAVPHLRAAARLALDQIPDAFEK